MNSSVSKTPVFGRIVCAAAGLGLLLGVTGCSSPAKESDAASYLSIVSIVAAPGAAPETTTSTLASDVRTFGTAYADPMLVTLRLHMKDPLFTPSPTNYITVQKYRVVYTRADGGPVPEPFDAAASFTVTTEEASSGPIVLVRAQAKNQSPLLQLVGLGSSAYIPVTAQVTFSGVDQAGNSASVSGFISVSFADWDDPGGDPVTPVASFTFAPAGGIRQGQNVIFDASASVVPSGRTVASYAWSWGDGSAGLSSLSPTAPHVFNGTGTFTVRLTVTDSAGQTYIAERIITVNP